MVGPARQVFVEEAPDAVVREEAAGRHALRGEALPEGPAQAVEEPAREGDVEAPLAARQDRRRQTLPDGPVARTEDPLAALVSAAERARLRDALARLSHGDCELLRLSFFEAVTPTQLARRLGEPVERIRKRKSRALERLRRAFFGEGRGHGA